MSEFHSKFLKEHVSLCYRPAVAKPDAYFSAAPNRPLPMKINQLRSASSKNLPSVNAFHLMDI